MIFVIALWLFAYATIFISSVALFLYPILLFNIFLSYSIYIYLFLFIYILMTIWFWLIFFSNIAFFYFNTVLDCPNTANRFYTNIISFPSIVFFFLSTALDQLNTIYINALELDSFYNWNIDISFFLTFFYFILYFFDLDNFGSLHLFFCNDNLLNFCFSSLFLNFDNSNITNYIKTEI